MKDQRRTGRTTNMLRYAIQRWRNNMPTIVVGADRNHAKLLEVQLQQMLNERDAERAASSKAPISVIAMHAALHYNSNHGKYCYATNRFTQGNSQSEVLFDHFAMETRLTNIVKYLDAAQRVVSQDLWLINAARMLSVSSAVSVFVADASFEYFTEKLEVSNVQVTKISDLDLYTELPLSSTQRTYTLYQPSALRDAFRGALDQITRFE